MICFFIQFSILTFYFGNVLETRIHITRISEHISLQNLALLLITYQSCLGTLQQNKRGKCKHRVSSLIPPLGSCLLSSIVFTSFYERFTLTIVRNINRLLKPMLDNQSLFQRLFSFFPNSHPFFVLLQTLSAPNLNPALRLQFL